MVVWTNSHGGFLAGLCVYLAYLGLRGVEAYRPQGPRLPMACLLRFGLDGARPRSLATLLNPYGFAFHRWLYHDLAVPRPEIVEWRSPDLFDLQFLPFWLLVAGWHRRVDAQPQSARPHAARDPGPDPLAGARASAAHRVLRDRLRLVDAAAL